jgi:uncharacterized phage-associated protein
VKGIKMANVIDVAAYILKKRNHLSAMKLQKLVYYSQAWHLVWDEKPLFNEHIEAWANGPVCPTLYRAHWRQFSVDADSFAGDASTITPSEASTIDTVLSFYAEMSGMELSELTHREAPWLDARGGLPMGARSQTEITTASMAEYYGGLV